MRRLFLSAVLTATLGSPALAAPPNPANPASPTGPTQPHPALVTFGPSAQVELAPHTTATVRRLTQLAIPTTGATPLERATRFLDAHRAPLGLAHLRYAHRDTTALPRGLGHVVRFALALDISKTETLEIQDSSLTVRLDRDGQVRAYTSDALPFALPSTAPAITPEAAVEAARAHYAAAAFGTPRLVVRLAAAHHATLAYRVPVALVPLQAHFFVWVDAQTAAILGDAPAGFDQPVRRLPLRSTEAPK